MLLQKPLVHGIEVRYLLKPLPKLEVNLTYLWKEINDRAYIDSDVLIWHLRGNEIATEFLRKLKSLKEYELWIGAMQRAEIVFCMRTAEEKATELFLWQF